MKKLNRSLSVWLFFTFFFLVSCKKTNTTHCWDCIARNLSSSVVPKHDTLCGYTNAPEPTVINYFLGTNIQYDCTKID